MHLNKDRLRSWLWVDEHLRYKNKLSKWGTGKYDYNNSLSNINVIKSSSVLFIHSKNKVMTNIS